MKNYGSDIMEVTYEASFNKPLIPEGEYKAEFIGIKELERTKDVDYDRVVLNFRISEGSCEGVLLGRVCGTRCTAGTALGKFAASMSGTPLDSIKEGFSVDLAKFEGRFFRISVETVIPKKSGEKYSSVGKVYGVVKEGSGAESPAPSSCPFTSETFGME